jgi:hypothetical protein
MSLPMPWAMRSAFVEILLFAQGQESAKLVTILKGDRILSDRLKNDDDERWHYDEKRGRQQEDTPPAVRKQCSW